MTDALTLTGWEGVAPFIDEAEPPPIQEGEWVAASDFVGSGWADVGIKGVYKGLGAAYGHHPKRNFEVARMWAAAPELIEALQAMLDDFFDGAMPPGENEIVDRARAALAKARGGS